MKLNGWWVMGVLLVATAAAHADKLEWACDELDGVQCPQAVDKTDVCNATDGVDTFLDRAERDDDEKATENKCIVSLRIANEICGSRFNPTDFDLTCTDKDDPPSETPAEPTPPSEPGDDGDRPERPRHHEHGHRHHHRHHGGTPGEGHPGEHGHHGGYHHHGHRHGGWPPPRHRHHGGGGDFEN